MTLVAGESAPAGGSPGGRSAVSFRRLLLGLVSLGLLILLAVSAATVLLVSSNQESTRWVDHTYRVEQQLSNARGDFYLSEAARRGYLITRDPYYLGVYGKAAGDLPRRLARVKALTADNPRQQVAVARLLELVDAKLKEQQSSIDAMREAHGRADPAALIRENQPMVTRIRIFLDAMVAEESRLLQLRTEGQTANAEDLLVVVLASVVVIMLLSGASFLLMRRYSADLDRTQTALRRLNLGLEDEVRRRTSDLTRANDEIQRFAYIVSHDLRSPLVNVMGFTSELETAARPLRELIARLQSEAPHLLTRGAQEAVEIDLPESLGFIRSSTQKMDRLINAILRLSREGRRNLTPESIDMAAVLEGIIASLKQQTDAKGAVIAVEGELPDLVNDRLAVEQVFSNVVENALKYLKPGRPGDIRIRGHAHGDTRTFEVQDNGRGIAPTDHERVFELFRRAGAQDQPGEGIGLAHVRALVYRLNGTITVDSELDRGATFRICLPAVISVQAPSPPEERP